VYLITELGEGGAQHREPSPPPAAALGTRMPTPTTTLVVPPEPVEFATPRIADLTLDADHDDNLVARYRRMEDLLEGGEPLELAARELEEEMASIIENKTWSLEDMPPETRAIGLKSEFKQ